MKGLIENEYEEKRHLKKLLKAKRKTELKAVHSE